MRDTHAPTTFLVLALAAMGCDAGRSRPAAREPPVPGFDASGDDAQTPDDGGVPPVTDSGNPSPADADAEGPSDASDDGAESEAAPVFPPACPTWGRWSTSARVASIAPAGFDWFGAISADARAVAWTTAAGAVYVADRASPADPFGAPALLDPGTYSLTSGRVALAPTGLELIATLADGSSFIGFYRASAGAAWSPSAGKEFETVATMRGESGGAFSEPVVSADGSSLFYLLALPNQPPVLYESPWDTSLRQWGLGAALSSPELAMTTAAQVRRATGASSDRLTLFYFDEIAGTERAAWREAPGSPFTMFAALAALPEAAPVGDCSVLDFRGQTRLARACSRGLGRKKRGVMTVLFGCGVAPRKGVGSPAPHSPSGLTSANARASEMSSQWRHPYTASHNALAASSRANVVGRCRRGGGGARARRCRVRNARPGR